MKIFLEKAWFWGQKEYRGERENDFSALQDNSGWKGPRRALVQPSAPRGSALDHPGLCRLGNLKGWRLQPAPLTQQGQIPISEFLPGNQEQMWPVVAFETILLLWRGRNAQLWVLEGLCLLCLLCFGRVFISLSQWSCSRWCKISLGRVCWLSRKTANRKFGWCGPHCLLCMGEHRTGFLFVSYLVPIYLFPIHCKDAAKDRKCAPVSTLMTGNFWRAAEWWSVGAAWGAQCLALSGCPSANSSFCLSMADQSQELWMLYNYNPISSWYLLKQVCVINAACLEAVPALLISPQGFLFSFLGFS